MKVGLFLAGLGYLGSARFILVYLDTQTALAAFLLWYVLFYLYILIVGFVLFHGLERGVWRMLQPRHLRVTFGIVIFTFAVGIVLYWAASGWSLRAVGLSTGSVPPFLIASEDGVTYSFWNLFLPPDPSGWMTYYVTPFVLGFIATYVLTPQKTTQALKMTFGGV